MKNLRMKNPREFWKIWNRVKSKDKNDVTTESLFNFFKDINKNKYSGEEYVLNNALDQERSNSLLYDKITKEEVITAIKYGQNNKSPGGDKIINEYIGSSIDCMIDIYVHLFNVGFDTGFLPKAWLIGNILPILKKG